jgi:hypothetical protein
VSLNANPIAYAPYNTPYGGIPASSGGFPPASGWPGYGEPDRMVYPGYSAPPLPQTDFSSDIESGKMAKPASWKQFLLNTASVIVGGGLLVGIPAFLFRKTLRAMWKQVNIPFMLPPSWGDALTHTKAQDWPKAWKSLRTGMFEFFDVTQAPPAPRPPSGKTEAEATPELSEAKGKIQRMGQAVDYILDTVESCRDAGLRDKLLPLADTLDKLHKAGLEKNLLEMNRNLEAVNGVFRQFHAEKLLEPERVKGQIKELSGLLSSFQGLQNSSLGYWLGLSPKK